MALRFGRTIRRTPTRPATAPGERIYAIGDVHGRFDLLRALLDKIEAHAAALPRAERTHVVQVGDLVDRGPQSAEVLRLLIGAQRTTEALVVLRGNHEAVMVEALNGQDKQYRMWRGIGGGATMRSLGVEPPPRGEPAGDVMERVRAAIPPGWTDWMARLPLTARSGDYLFCHAGIRPGVPLRRQSPADLMWIRDEFLEDDTDHGVIVVHGHSISDGVDWRMNRIGIDTGAYRTDVLTALYLEGEVQELIATGPADAAGPAPAPAER